VILGFGNRNCGDGPLSTGGATGADCRLQQLSDPAKVCGLDTVTPRGLESVIIKRAARARRLVTRAVATTTRASFRGKRTRTIQELARLRRVLRTTRRNVSDGCERTLLDLIKDVRRDLVALQFAAS
jgi:hypothetical protein